MERTIVGKKFKYYDTITHKEIKERNILDRINKLCIPPQWKNIWISRDPTSYLQVKGVDNKGRVQYIYHPLWVTLTSVQKYSRIRNFCCAQPLLEKAIGKDLVMGRSNYEIALMFLIMKNTHIRVGNEIYVQSGSYGLTTLEKRHVRLIGNRVVLEFIGKKGVPQKLQCSLEPQEVGYLKTRLASIKTHDRVFRVTSKEMNEYLKKVMGDDFTCKDFRTYASNLLFLKTLKSLPHPKTKKDIIGNIKYTYDYVAKCLGHTKAISKKSYVMPLIEECYKENPDIIEGKNCESLLLEFISK